MRKLFIIMLAMAVLSMGTIGFAGKDKTNKKAKSKSCYNICAQAHKADVKQCIDTNQKPLSECIGKANDAKKDCRAKCQKKK